jgi:hypothetical protein
MNGASASPVHHATAEFPTYPKIAITPRPLLTFVAEVGTIASTVDRFPILLVYYLRKRLWLFGRLHFQDYRIVTDLSGVPPGRRIE